MPCTAAPKVTAITLKASRAPSVSWWWTTGTAGQQQDRRRGHLQQTHGDGELLRRHPGYDLQISQVVVQACEMRAFVWLSGEGLDQLDAEIPSVSWR